MPSTRCHSYNLNFKLKIVAEAEAVNNNCEIAREYGLQQTSNMSLFTGKLKMTAKRASMDRYRPKDPELLISSWQTGIATKEAKVKIVYSISMHRH